MKQLEKLIIEATVLNEPEAEVERHASVTRVATGEGFARYFRR